MLYISASVLHQLCSFILTVDMEHLNFVSVINDNLQGNDILEFYRNQDMKRPPISQYKRCIHTDVRAASLALGRFDLVNQHQHRHLNPAVHPICEADKVHLIDSFDIVLGCMAWSHD